MEKSTLQNIRPKNVKGKKEKDHLFLDPDSKTIYYAELKSNLNLDTEKSKSTYEKCISNLKELQEQYPDHTVNMYLVGLRYFKKAAIPNKLSKKYESIKEHLVGINEYLTKLKIPIRFSSEAEYKLFLNYLATKMFSSCELPNA